MPDTDYGSLMLAEVSRRAWAVEQAVAGGEVGAGITERADILLAYLETPQREASAKLLAAGRQWDGTVDPAALIGALCDEIERMQRGG